MTARSSAHGCPSQSTAYSASYLDGYPSGSLLKDGGSLAMTVQSSAHSCLSQSTAYNGSYLDGCPDNITSQSEYLLLGGKFCRYYCGTNTAQEHTPNHSKQNRHKTIQARSKQYFHFNSLFIIKFIDYIYSITSLVTSNKSNSRSITCSCLS